MEYGLLKPLEDSRRETFRKWGSQQRALRRDHLRATSCAYLRTIVEDALYSFRSHIKLSFGQDSRGSDVDWQLSGIPHKHVHAAHIDIST